MIIDTEAGKVWLIRKMINENRYSDAPVHQIAFFGTYEDAVFERDFREAERLNKFYDNIFIYIQANIILQKKIDNLNEKISYFNPEIEDDQFVISVLTDKIKETIKKIDRNTHEIQKNQIEINRNYPNEYWDEVEEYNFFRDIDSFIGLEEYQKEQEKENV